MSELAFLLCLVVVLSHTDDGNVPDQRKIYVNPRHRLPPSMALGLPINDKHSASSSEEIVDLQTYTDLINSERPGLGNGTSLE